MTQHSEPLPGDPGAPSDAARAATAGNERSRVPWLARWLFEAPSRWLGTGSGVAQDVAGGTDGLSYLRHLARGNRIRRQASFENVDDRTRRCSSSTASSARAARCTCSSAGWSTTASSSFSFNLGTLNIRDIRRSAFLIHRKIERILAQTPVAEDRHHRPLDGRADRPLLRQEARRPRARPPADHDGHADPGTWAALAGVVTLGLWSTSSWQLLPRSRFLDELAQGPLPPEVEIYTIAAARDWVVPAAEHAAHGRDRRDRPARPLEPGRLRGGLPGSYLRSSARHRRDCRPRDADDERRRRERLSEDVRVAPATPARGGRR